MIGLYSADIAGLFGGTGGGNPLFPIAVEDDGDTLACKNEKILNINVLFNVIFNSLVFRLSVKRTYLY